MDFMRLVTKLRLDVDTVTSEPIPDRDIPAGFVNQ